MSNGNSRNNTKFWVPILIMAIISVVSVTTNVFLGAARATQANHIERLLAQQQKIIDTNHQQDVRLTRVEDCMSSITKELEEINRLLAKHMEGNKGAPAN